MSDIFSSEYLCRDCRHCFLPLSKRILYTIFFTRAFSSEYKCKMIYKESSFKYEPVTGGSKNKSGYEDCFIARQLYGHCGLHAQHWSPKNKRDLFKLLTKENK